MKSYIKLMLFFSLFISCKKEQDLNILNELFWVRHGGADMPVHIHGDLTNEVILLIVHGGPGGNGLEYRSGKYTVPLEENFAVAYWDQRGQGMSHGKFNNSDLTIDRMVSDLDAVIKVLNTKYSKAKIVVLGHSWGGTLTAKYMISGKVHESVSAWIESNGAHDIPKLNKDAVKMFKAISNEQIYKGNNSSNWNDILDWAHSIDTNNITEEQSMEINSKAFEAEEWLTDDGIIASPESGGNKISFFTGPVNPLTSFLSGSFTNFKLSQEIENTALTNQLYKVTVPTLVLWGKYDFVVPPSLGIDTFNKISSSKKRIIIFQRSGHSPMSNEWNNFSKSIISFIEEL